MRGVWHTVSQTPILEAQMALSDLLQTLAAPAAQGIRPLPDIDARHESNVRGLYIVGDLADAPVIKIALQQGHTVAQAVLDSLPPTASRAEGGLDVVVIGAGPAGIGAALALQARGARFVVLERSRPFSTIADFPKGKLIFSEPREVDSPALWFEDAPKEELVARWDAALAERALPIDCPAEVTAVTRSGEEFVITAATAEGERQYRARRVILATGKRGEVSRLGAPGEELPHVTYALRDPAEHAGQDVLVVGGGDSAVESAVALAEAGARPTVSYRGEGFHRAKLKNQQRLAALVARGAVALRERTQVADIAPGRSTLRHADGHTEDVAADAVLVHIGTRLPVAFLGRLGVRLRDAMTPGRAGWLVLFALLTYVFYVLKSGVQEVDGVLLAKRALFPFGAGEPLGWLPGALQVDLGFRVVDGAFWGTLTYALLILVFGVRAWRRYPDPEQRRRYVSLIAFQWIFLFGIPELLAPAVIGLGGEDGLFFRLFGGDRGWKFYALSVPWPLNIWALIDAPSWSATGSTLVVGTWLLLAALVSFVLVPLYVRREGQRFCSYLCGCGGLAETLGDLWRHLAPRGMAAKKAEGMGRLIFLLAIPTTGLIVSDAWGLLSSGALVNAKSFAQHWYTLMVDFWLASVLGVALYPYLGNRVWCRFFCPLRAYMEELARRTARIAIAADERCIGCGECTRYCQMGIDVQQFAQKQVLLTNENSACIQCGICIQVCPMDVLSLRRGERVSLSVSQPLRPPAAAWEHRAW